MAYDVQLVHSESFREDTGGRWVRLSLEVADDNEWTVEEFTFRIDLSVGAPPAPDNRERLEKKLFERAVDGLIHVLMGEYTDWILVHESDRHQYSARARSARVGLACLLRHALLLSLSDSHVEAKEEQTSSEVDRAPDPRVRVSRHALCGTLKDALGPNQDPTGN